MPQDFNIDDYMSNMTSKSSSRVQDKYSHIIKDEDKADASAKTSGKTSTKHKTWDYYTQNSASFENNISLFFPDTQTGDGQSINNWTKRLKNIANNKYGNVIQKLYNEHGKSEATSAWRTVQDESRELLDILSKITLDKDDKGNVTITDAAEDVTEEQVTRLGELRGKFDTNWSKATTFLYKYTDKEGNIKDMTPSQLKYIYDEDRDEILSIDNYKRFNSDILPGQTFVTELDGMDNKYAGYNSWIKKSGYVDPRVTQRVGNIMMPWMTNTFNNLSEGRKSAFSTSTKWNRNRDFADSVFREIIDIGSESGIGNYTKEDILKFKKDYENSAGGSEGNPYDVRKQIKWLEKNKKDILKLTTALSPMQQLELYNLYNTTGSGNASRPGYFKTSKAQQKEVDEFTNYFDDYMIEHNQLNNTMYELNHQAIREMKLYIDGRGGAGIVGGTSNANGKVHYPAASMYYDKPGVSGVKEKYTAIESPFLHRNYLGNFFLTSGGKVRTVGELEDFLAGSEKDLFKEFVDKKEKSYNASVSIGGYDSLTAPEQQKLMKTWEHEFDTKVLPGIDLVIRTGLTGNIWRASLKREYDLFHDKYAETFSNLDPSHAYKRSSVVGGYKMKGNYSLRQEFIDFKTHDDPQQNHKNQNASRILDMVQSGFKADVNEKVFDKDGEYLSSDDTSPTVFFTIGKLNHSLDVGDTGQLNDLTYKGHNYTKENQDKYLSAFIKKTAKGEWDMEYFNTTANSEYKAYTFTKRKPTKEEKSSGEDTVTIYVKGDHAKSSGEEFASAEYNDSNDFIFDTKGSYAITHLQELGGRSKVNTDWHESGSIRIKGLNIVNINGSKYAEYEELDKTGEYGTQRTYLGPSHSLSIDDAIKRVEQLLTKYNNAQNQLETSPSTPIQEIISNSIL
jgi:hypothetical protein